MDLNRQKLKIIPNKHKKMKNKSDKPEILSEEELYVSESMIENSGLDRETIKDIRRTYKKQKEEKKNDGAGWDFWDERVHVENLLCQRFNYLILCYSLFIAAFSVINDKISKIIILSVGFIVIFLISLFVRRAWYKLDLNLKFLFVLYEDFNGIQMIDRIVKEKSRKIDSLIIRKVKYNRLIGEIIPLFMSLSLLLGILFIAFGWWNGGSV